MVVTMRDGQIVEMKGCADRANAISYVQTGWVRLLVMFHRGAAGPVDAARAGGGVRSR